MEEAFSFFRAFEVWIYLLIGFGALIYIRKFVLAWGELSDAAFGLERESAQTRLNRAAIVLVILVTMAISEFVLVYYVAPSIPESSPLPSATLSLLATPSVTLPENSAMMEVTNEVLENNQSSAPSSNGCIPGQIDITSPQNGQEVTGVVEVIGSADIPSFGFYKLEIKRPDENIWSTLQAGNAVVLDGKLGDWDTRRLTPGEYQLSIVLVDNEAQALEPCINQVRVALTPEDTPSP